MIQNSIRLKLIIPTILIILATTLSTLFLSRNALRETLADEFRARGLAFGQVLATNIQETILNRDASMIQGAIDEYRNTDGINFLLIISEKNEVIAHTFYPSIPPYYQNLIAENHEQKYSIDPEMREEVINGQSQYIMRFPILAGLLGSLYIGMGIDQKQKEVLSPLVRDLAMVDLVLIVLASILSTLLINKFTSPLINLTRFARAFSSKVKKFSPLKVSTDDEIGRLTHAFNDMTHRILSYTNDLESEVKKRTNLIQEQQMLLANSAKLSALGEMAASIAHEINNPLTIISSSTYVLRKQINKENPSKEAILKILNDTDRTVERISKIIQGLRNLSRNSNDEDFTQSTLKEIFADVLNLTEDKFRRSEIDFQFNGDLSLLETQLKCRPIQLSQVFINLLNNSYDALMDQAQGKKWITVEFTRSDGMLEVHFSNSGPAIDEKIREKIFNPFFTTKQVGKGTGLGLSLSKSIVEHHKGELSLDASSTHTHFIIKLPLEHS